MSIALLSFLTLSLFMLHEFDEIIQIRPWIRQNEGNPHFQKEIFIAGKAAYPSTESLAFMIAEEFLLAFFLLLAAILAQLSELALAVSLCHTFHLLAHIRQVLQFHRWLPGGLTAVLTFPILLLILLYYSWQQTINWVLLLPLTVIIMIFLLWNLQTLHKKAEKMEGWIQRQTHTD